MTEYKVQTSKGPVRFHSVGEPIVEQRSGYIPEGGVWTAQERGAFKVLASGHVPIPLEGIERADSTVAALIAALEDLINGHPAVTGAQAERLHKASDLLDSLK